ncbi:divalent-cation tolerance protein CutA [Streptomyces sp. NPDC051320]|uniref:divalent-cation tolerance protein CutA n=1 Tax=Streptomyces sp. NPDC051320 TaxID=3154644 RepID=UPI003420619A
MTEVCSVVITAPDSDWLAEFVRDLVAHRLCAGSHITTPIRSIYRWQDQVHDVAEAHVALHTRSDHVAEIVARADARHPYEVPCVVSTPILSGNPAYLRWIIEQTERL